MVNYKMIFLQEIPRPTFDHAGDKNEQIFLAKFLAYNTLVPQYNQKLAVYYGKYAQDNQDICPESLALRGLANQLAFLREELWLESEKTLIPNIKDLPDRTIYCDLVRNTVHVRGEFPDRERPDADLNMACAQGFIVRLNPLKIDSVTRQKRDRLFSEMNDRNPITRLNALVNFRKMLDDKELPESYVIPVSARNNHCHTNHDHNSAGSLEYHVARYAILGLDGQGLKTHFSANGSPDFYIATRIMRVPNVVYGYESLVSMPRQDVEYNFPGVPGLAYVEYNVKTPMKLIDYVRETEKQYLQSARFARQERLAGYVRDINDSDTFKTVGITLDFVTDIRVLTDLGNPEYSTRVENGNATEKHLAQAIAEAIGKHCKNNPEEVKNVLISLINEWRDLLRSMSQDQKLIASLTKEEPVKASEEKLLNDPVTYTDLIRNKVIKILLALYGPSSKEVRPAAEVNRYPVIADYMSRFYLELDGGTCEAERRENAEQTLIEVCNLGFEGVGIIRNRVWRETEKWVTDLAKKVFAQVQNGRYSLIDALDVNAPGMTGTWSWSDDLAYSTCAAALSNRLTATKEELMAVQAEIGRKQEYLDYLEHLIDSGVLVLDDVVVPA